MYNSILVIAGREYHEFYRHLSIKDGQTEFCAFGEPVDEHRFRTAEIMLLDCGFDSSRGLYLLRQIKARQPGVPLIFLTDSDRAEIAINAFKAGAREYFVKPVSIPKLQKTVARLMDLKRTTHGPRPAYVSEEDTGFSETFKSLTTDKPENLLRVIRFIEENLPRPITLDSLAREANLSRHHFCRFFKKHVGISPIKYMKGRRVERAKEMLRIRSMSVSFVAAETGFDDLGTFIRQFKSQMRLTPTEYRKSISSQL